MNNSLAATGDLSPQALWLALALGVAALALLGWEIFRTGGKKTLGTWGVAGTGALAIAALVVAVLRPVAIASRASLVGPKIILLADASRSIDLPGLSGTRRETLGKALAAFRARAGEARTTVLAFGDGTPHAVAGSKGDGFAERPLLRSDLTAALEALSKSEDERPQAVVVLSDGRLDRPGETGTAEATKAALAGLGDAAAADVPIHTLALADEAPADASIRAVKASGAAVAHQPFSLRVDVGCEHLDCGDIPIVARELRERGKPVLLASGTAHVENGKATIELSMTIDRAGARILEVEMTPPAGDTIPENDKRYIELDVTRDRVRLLHVAGRPTYDVRALRMWLKSDASVDVVAFFILRTLTDEVNATQEELALIPFPVDELFSTHLSSFDAVVLQDFDATPYGLTKHLPSLARYVEKGGGLIMVGGPDAFVGGHYAGTELGRALPVELDPKGAPSDLSFFTPRFTPAGRFAPVLAPLRALIGEDLPEMPGTSIVGNPKVAHPDGRGATVDEATVLLEHPWRTTPSGAAMPILTLGSHGDGRTIALTIDGSHRLLFSAFAANAAGRAHGAFWDAMLGWLMRDPRFEPAAVEVRGACIAGEPTTIVMRPLPGPAGEATLKITRLGGDEVVATAKATLRGDGSPVELAGGALEAGGYTATVEVQATGAKGAITKRDFACEKGGDEWADSRPDTARLKAIAAATGGTYALATDVGKIPLPAAKEIAAERRVAPILPPWAWTALAASALGLHWIMRRRQGLA